MELAGSQALSTPVAFPCKVVGFVMPLTEFADDDAMINLVHALLDLRPKRAIWQSIPMHQGTMLAMG